MVGSPDEVCEQVKNLSTRVWVLSPSVCIARQTTRTTI